MTLSTFDDFVAGGILGYGDDPFAHMSDDDLLDAPAHLLAESLHRAASGGRDYVTGDDVDTTYAAVRVQDGNQLDFYPKLDWSTYNPIDDPEPGMYPVNWTISNKSIPPRVSEPSIPAQTKVTGWSLTRDDVPIGPLEQSLVHAAQAVQLMKRAKGDYIGLAQALGAAWGDEALFDPDEPTDLLGDVSLPRVLASAGKRRYEIYRNVGWTSLVTAGYSEATADSYGPGSIINWQRRVELAKVFIHMAIALEGLGNEPFSSFEICVRIPSWTVRHRLWEDLGFQVGKMVPSLGDIKVLDRARQFLNVDMRHALTLVANGMVASGVHIDWGIRDFEQALQFNRLTYFTKLPEEVRPRNEFRASEIATEQLTLRGISFPVATKALDMRVAVLEALHLMEPAPDDLPSTLAFCYRLMLNGVHMSQDQRIDAIFDKRTFQRTIALRLVAGTLVRRPKTLEDRHRRAEWQRVYDDQMPERIKEHTMAYTVQGVVMAVLYTCLSDKTSAAGRTLAFAHKKVSDLLSEGVTKKAHVVFFQRHNVLEAMTHTILQDARQLFRTRYRAYGDAHGVSARVWKVLGQRTAETIKMAGRYALSDFVHHVLIAKKADELVAVLPKDAAQSVWAVYASHLKTLDNQVTPLLKLLAPSAVFFHVQNRVQALGYEVDSAAEGSPLWVRTRVDKFLDEVNEDLKKLMTALHAPPPQPKQPTTHEFKDNVDMLDQLFAGKLPVLKDNSVDSVVSYWAFQAGGIYDPDDIDELVAWMKRNGPLVRREFSVYLEVHSNGIDKAKARVLLDEWTDLRDEADEEDAERNELG